MQDKGNYLAFQRTSKFAVFCLPLIAPPIDANLYKRRRVLSSPIWTLHGRLTTAIQPGGWRSFQAPPTIDQPEYVERGVTDVLHQGSTSGSV
jgi:hypothetical protein